MRPDRPSNSVSRTLRAHGYRVIPVNPALRGEIVEGERSYDRLVDIPKDAKVDFVDVFRRGEYLDSVVDDAIAAGIKTMASVKLIKEAKASEFYTNDLLDPALIKKIATR